MKVTSVQLGLYETNCYIIYDEASQQCVITDPGYEPERVLGKIKELGLSLKGILLTHGHFDHVGAVRPIAEATGCAVYINERETAMPRYMTAGELFYTDTYDDGDVIRIANMEFRVLATPGHSPGSVCLLCENCMFSGDTLFRGACGRTDSPGGSWQQILASLRKLAQLETDYKVYPGHGMATNLQYEKRGNHFILEALRQ